jgi:hypothetical protein
MLNKENKSTVRDELSRNRKNEKFDSIIRVIVQSKKHRIRKIEKKM